MKYIALLLFFVSAVSSVAESSASPKAQETFVDAVVASVDGAPITLSELSARMDPPKKISLKEASIDPEARLALDKLLLEHLVNAGAETRKLSVSPQEIEAYINEVAARNQMSRAEFEVALKKEKHSIEAYREQLKTEILKTKIASQMMQGGVGVTEEEIKDYIKMNPSLTQSGSKLRISQIFASSAGRDPEEARVQIQAARAELDGGANFADVARRFSDGPEGADGGSLGVISEEELSPLIFEAIFSIPDGTSSAIVESPNGFHIFQVDERFVQEEETSEQVIEEARRMLKQQKLEVKLQNYFTSDLYKLHSVDKKI